MDMKARGKWMLMMRQGIRWCLSVRKRLAEEMVRAFEMVFAVP